MKSIFKSKVFWANAIAIGVIVAKQALQIESLPEVDPTVLAIVNLVLRLITKEGVKIPVVSK